MCADESAADERVCNRNVGHSKRGTPARSSISFFHRGVRYSVMGPYVLGGGFLDAVIIEGAFTADRFLHALITVVRAIPLPTRHTLPAATPSLHQPLYLTNRDCTSRVHAHHAA